MKLYRTAQGSVLEERGRFHSLQMEWDELINHDDLVGDLQRAAAAPGARQIEADILAPIESQEVWAAGVTYFRSRSARIEELLIQIKDQLTVVIVTHNMQQAARVSEYTVFMLMGEMVEYGLTRMMFTQPADKRTEDYITGRFG